VTLAHPALLSGTGGQGPQNGAFNTLSVLNYLKKFHISRSFPVSLRFSTGFIRFFDKTGYGQHTWKALKGVIKRAHRSCGLCALSLERIMLFGLKARYIGRNLGPGDKRIEQCKAWTKESAAVRT
jgi:hypothetical protein